MLTEKISFAPLMLYNDTIIIDSVVSLPLGPSFQEHIRKL